MNSFNRSCFGLLAFALSLSASRSSGLARTFCALMTLMALAACGFQPVYQKIRNSVHTELLQVDVPIMNGDRTEQLFSTTLADALNPQSRSALKPYLFQAAVKKVHEPAIIQQDREITRYRVSLEVKYTLIEKETGKVVLKDTAKQRASYDDLTSEFANYSSQVDAEERAARELAETVRMRLITFFAK